MNKENNILLAEFLGLKSRVFNSGILNYLFDNTFYEVDELSFEISWDWLMEVVKKIESIETKDKRTFTIDFYRDSVLIFEYGTHTNEIIFTEGKGRFENLYNACVQFAKWYNENN